MIQVLARKAIQFRNPNKALVNKQAKIGESNQVSMTTKLEDAFCRVIPDKVTLVPDWVKLDPIFDWCVKDGTLMEIVVNPSVPGSDLQAKGQAQIAANQSAEDKAAAEKAKADLKAKLAAKIPSHTLRKQRATMLKRNHGYCLTRNICWGCPRVTNSI